MTQNWKGIVKADHIVLWLYAKRANLTIAPAADITPGSGEIAVRAYAVAVDPFDRYVQAMGDIITGYLTYPTVLGSEVAGEVVAVGPDVRRFRIDDRVL